MGIPALPFCKVTLKGKRPLPPAYPNSLKTLGDHLRKRRLDLKLLQKEVAQKLGVDKASIHNWETHRTNPSLPIIPKIIEFLGYIPFETSNNLAEKIKAYRKLLGITQKSLAKELQIDPGTLARWEGGKGRVSKELLETLNQFFASVPLYWSKPGE
jgi:transcriptional regulator with XRE-family HTH domain